MENWLLYVSAFPVDGFQQEGISPSVKDKIAIAKLIDDLGVSFIEGGLNAVLSAAVTLIVFGPILWYFGAYGIPLPIDYSEMGLIIAKRLIPVYTIGLVVSTTILVSIIVLIVSYIPSRRIAKMKPTDALRGKVME